MLRLMAWSRANTISMTVGREFAHDVFVSQECQGMLRNTKECLGMLRNA